MVKVLKENKLEQESVLFILDEIDLNLHLSARNIPNVEVATVKKSTQFYYFDLTGL